MLRYAGALLAALLLAPGAARAQAEAGATEPVWEVEDRFRLFSEADEASRQRVAMLMQRLAADPRGAPLSRHHDAFLHALAYENGESLRTSNYQPVGRRSRYGSGRYRRDYLYANPYRISVRSGDPRHAGRLCRWRTDHGEAEGPCVASVTLAVGPGGPVADGWGVDTPLFRSVDGGEEAAAGRIRFQDLFVLALGDSYISGEGNPDVPSVITDRPLPMFEHASWGARLSEARGDYRAAQWWDEPCHRSLLSWPVLASLAHSARNPRRAVTLVHLGCSGATVADILTKGEVELPGGGDELPGEFQLAQLERLIEARPPGSPRRRPDRVLLSVGGNDSGFVGVIKTLLLPPGGYWVPRAEILVGRRAKAICPYDNTGQPLERLCNSVASAEHRLSNELPGAYADLAEALAFQLPGDQRPPVYHFTYPNPLLGEHGWVCDIRPPRDPRTVTEMGGFEAIMGYLPGFLRGFRYTWDFHVQHYAERGHPVGGETVTGSTCDRQPEPGDSEACQGLWVHDRLNQLIRSLSSSRWRIVEDHAGMISGHGVCRQDRDFPPGLPRVAGGGWVDGWTPQSYHPYHRNNQRWFRTTNDSVVTQYGDADHFFHGTFHPTFSAHLAYAQAALTAALAD